MRIPSSAVVFALCVCLCVCLSPFVARSAEPAVDQPAQVVVATAKKPATDEAGEEFFERKIRPLLAQHCYSCHGRGQTKGGLGLDSREALLAGGDSGAAIVLGKPDESLLIEAVHYDSFQMPPSGKMADDEIAALRQWVTIGAPWPAEAVAAASSGGSIRTEFAVTDADRKFWSFQPIRDPAVPPVADASWPRRPLDQFILARLESEGLSPSPEADPRTFIRRATFDLLGLPPTMEEVDDFVNQYIAATSGRGGLTDRDQRSRLSESAYEALVERLLASPHFGERWARHWLDVARYGEDQAHTFQARNYPAGYRYRDWVVESFNRDLPYDQFVMQQIAGDLLDDGSPADDADRQERLPALGFFALGPVYYNGGGCGGKALTDEYDDRVDTLGRGLLGLTLACARCHDHKFDPISTHDYYALAGVFAGSKYVEAALAPKDVVRRYDAAFAKHKDAERALKDAQTAAARGLAATLAERTADYLVALRTFEQRVQSEPKLRFDVAAKESGVEAPLLDRWRKFVEADRVGKHPLFAAWRALPPTATTDEVRRTAEAIQTVITTATRQRTAVEAHAAAATKSPNGKPKKDKSTDKPAIDKASADILKSLVDDRNAPLAVPANQLNKFLPETERQKLAEMEQTVEAAKKEVGEKYPIAHSLTEGTPTDLPVHIRGNHKDLGEIVPRRFPAVLSPKDAAPFKQGSGRLELALAVASADNPLTARVFVNRVWQQMFGRGLVGTPSNFGLLGERPTHPELLDHLASRFIASGWSTKQLLRDILLSSTYRQASTFRADYDVRDPENRLLWRMNRRRLDVESWRDAVLAASGELDLRLGGPSQSLDDANNRRRTLYAAISRHELHPMLRVFDFPDPNLTSERRVMTTVPMQQLFVLNSEFIVGRARALSASLLKELPSGDAAAQVDAAYRRALARRPTTDERAWAVEFLTSATAEPAADGKPGLSPLEQFVQALLSTNEFTFVD